MNRVVFFSVPRVLLIDLTNVGQFERHPMTKMVGQGVASASGLSRGYILESIKKAALALRECLFGGHGQFGVHCKFQAIDIPLYVEHCGQLSIR